jgi:hypothetical protein
VNKEVTFYNRLLDTIQTTLEKLNAYLEGQSQLTATLEADFANLMNDRVPMSWFKHSYPASGSLGEFIEDLSDRVDYIELVASVRKIESLYPIWISGWFDPRHFIMTLK